MLSERQRGAVSENRKITKSAMEKKRRARINTSLVELKSILAGIISHKSERFEKMEKADILEMTVKYVKQLQRSSEKLSDPTQTKDEQYKNGVNNCISEVIKYIAASDSCDTEIKSKLLDHLANRLSSADSTTSTNQNDNTPRLQHSHSGKESSPEPDSTATKLPPSPLTVNTSNVCSPILNTSPVGQQSHLSVQGQYTALPACSVVGTIPQTSPLMSNIPFTIIVPANFYASAPGTACVIPFNIPTSVAKTVQTPSNVQCGLLNTVTGIPSLSPQSSTVATTFVTLPSQSPSSTLNTSIESMELSPVLRDSVVESPKCSNEGPQDLTTAVNNRRQLYSRQGHSPSREDYKQASPDSLWRPWSGNV